MNRQVLDRCATDRVPGRICVAAEKTFTQLGAQTSRRTIWRGRTRSHSASGILGIELLAGLAISMIVMAVTAPPVGMSKTAFQLSSAVTRATEAIQNTRQQAMTNGYPFALTFDPTLISYQVSTKPPGAASFSNVGGAIHLAPNSNLTLCAKTILEFNPGGTVSATAGAMSFTMSMGNITKTVAVSKVGKVTVTP